MDRQSSQTSSWFPVTINGYSHSMIDMTLQQPNLNQADNLPVNSDWLFAVVEVNTTKPFSNKILQPFQNVSLICLCCICIYETLSLEQCCHTVSKLKTVGRQSSLLDPVLSFCSTFDDSNHVTSSARLLGLRVSTASHHGSALLLLADQWRVPYTQTSGLRKRATQSSWKMLRMSGVRYLGFLQAFYSGLGGLPVEKISNDGTL